MLSHFSRIRLCDPMDCSLPGSSVMGFSRQESWSGLLCLSPGDLPNPGIELSSLACLALAGLLLYFTTNATWEAQEKAHHAQKTSRNWWGWSPMRLMSIIGKEVKEKIGSQWSGRQARQLPVSQATPGSSSFLLTLVLLVFYQIFLGHHLTIILVLLTLPGLLSSFSFSNFLAN